MKKIFPVVCLMVVFMSCHHDIPEVGYDFSKLPTNGKRFVAYSERDCDIRDEKPWTKIPEDPVFDSLGNLVEDHSRKASSLVMTELATGVIESLASYKVHQVCGTYRSVDVNGNEITLSGAVFYPLDVPITHMLICSHYTVAANYEVPSQSFPLEAALAANGYLVVMADYLGYGVTQDRIHPYLQADVTARNVIDMALGVRAFVAERNIQIQSDKVVLVGFSQGAATSMWVQYYMEMDDEYKGKFNIKKNYCASGPYSVARTYDHCVKVDETGIPFAVPLIIIGMSEGMAQPLDLTTFFQEPLLSNYGEWLNSKKYNGLQVTQMIGVNRLSQILTPAGRDRSKGETQRLYRALQANSIPESYRPKAPIYMFHSMEDPTVPFVNAQVMRYNFSHYDIRSGAEPVNNVEYDFGHYGNHQKSCILFYLKMLKTL